MSNKTFIPAFRCKVGDWKYYVCTMKYGEVARQVQFAYEMGGNTELNTLIQRGITDRTKGIADYLLNSKHRFLGAIVVAAWGGEPTYTSLSMDDPDGMLKGVDDAFGVLTFDGTQNYFVLDGQHRLRAIKDAVLKKRNRSDEDGDGSVAPVATDQGNDYETGDVSGSVETDDDLSKEDICVLIVTHYNTKEGRVRTRRLFSNINRNAKQTGAAENIALDEDDSIAVLTRRLLEEHPFLREPGRVRVILSTNDKGGVRLAASQVPTGDPKAFTSISVLYEVLQLLSHDQPASVRNTAVRPPDEVLDDTYDVLSGRIDDLLRCCGEVGARLQTAASARDVRSPKSAPALGHPFMRPAVQKAVAQVIGEISQQGQVSWAELMSRLSALPWTLSSAPWIAVSTPDGKMITGKDNAELLRELLHAHLSPPSMQAIRRARRQFKDLRNANYPVSDEELAKRLQSSSGSAPQSVPQQ